jgi:hypothetical protein
MTTKGLIIRGVLVAALATLMVALPVLGVGETFTTSLSGAGEVPAVTTTATGEFVATLMADGSLGYTLRVSGIENVTAAHIHLAAAGVNGPVVVGLFGGPAKTGSFTGTLSEGTITAANLGGPLLGMTIDRLLTEIQLGNAYVNVHTTAHPSGEIRGQLKATMAP